MQQKTIKNIKAFDLLTFPILSLYQHRAFARYGIHSMDAIVRLLRLDQMYCTVQENRGDGQTDKWTDEFNPVIGIGATNEKAT